MSSRARAAVLVLVLSILLETVRKVLSDDLHLRQTRCFFIEMA